MYYPSIMLSASWALCGAVTLQVHPAHVAPQIHRRVAFPTMGARRPFKGGRLDDFVAAGEAEAKFGPRRYAAVAEDAWKVSVEQQETEESRAISAEVYARQKGQMLADHLLFSVVGVAGFWAFLSVGATLSYCVGAALGALYLVLLQRQTDSFGASSLEATRAGPPPIVVPVLMVLIVAKNPDVALLPTLAGFTTNYFATFAQLVYPADFGVIRPVSRSE